MIILGAFLLAAQPVAAAATAPSLQRVVEATLAEAGPGVRFGLMVTTLDGQEILAINPDGRFVPASNTKIFTTAAAYELLPGIDAADADGGARVRLDPANADIPNVILEGRGDARLSSAPDCVTDCLSTLADAVAARTRRVGSVIGDARHFADERWSFGMSWNNIPTRSGTGLAALTLDGNEAALRVVAGAAGEAPSVAVADYFAVENRAQTVAEGETELAVERLPGSRRILLSGTIVAGAAPELLRLGIDDPAQFAAWRLQRMLEERGVRVTAGALGRYRPAIPGSERDVLPPLSDVLAQVTPLPLAADIVTINKASQNVHAELLLRRLGAARGKASVAGGLEGVRALLDRAGVPARAADLADGSGMSPYNRVSPRGVVTLLRWAHGRPWGTAFRASLPVGGVDGTLARRFRGGPLHGRIFAKTGSLNAANALAGYLLGRSGRMLVFSILANDVPEDVRTSPIIDAALERVAQAL